MIVTDEMKKAASTAIAKARWGTARAILNKDMQPTTEAMNDMFAGAALTAAYPLIRAQVIEECAKVCDDLAVRVFHPNQTITDRCAQAIRGMKEDK